MGLRWKGLSPQSLGHLWAEADRSVRANARRALKEETQEIMEISIEQTPLETGEAEAAHRIVERQGNQYRIGYNIEIGGVVNGVDTDLYIGWLHEDQNYNLGKQSEIKNQGSSRTVGPKFLERAYEEREMDVIRAIREELEKFG